MKIIFLHIPKAAGSTLKEVLFRIYKKEYYLEAYDKLIKSDIDNINQQKLNEAELIHGHFNYGLHNFINNDSFRYITFLRNPAKRIISHYFYAKREKQHYLNKSIIENNISLEEYALSNLSIELDNAMVRQLTNSQKKINKLDSDDLEKAKKVLFDDKMVFGISEKFEESLFVLQHELMWKTIPKFKKQNVSKNKKQKLDPDLINKINSRNNLDYILYKEAVSVFNKRLNKIDNLNFKKIKFRILNMVFNP